MLIEIKSSILNFFKKPKRESPFKDFKAPTDKITKKAPIKETNFEDKELELDANDFFNKG